MAVKNPLQLNRRTFLQLAAATSFAGYSGLSFTGEAKAQTNGRPILKAIPSSGEEIPAVGMGTWVTFNVGRNKELLNHRIQILDLFFKLGGKVIDTSPMYGAATYALGYGFDRLAGSRPVFAADKIWTGGDDTAGQLQEQQSLWGLDVIDLMQVHNLLNWRHHLDFLRQKKEEGRIRYIGITTSHGRRHDEMEDIMANNDLDFVQLTYNILDREAEERLLPLAQERGIAVIANRPFKHKELFDRYQSYPLPDFAAEAGCKNWAEFFLKFIISHPAVTCAIPATSQLTHMRENMGALYGSFPDAPLRKRMAQYIASLS
jgi:diketogulonate reductase-like aldo/keto reductase